MRKIIYAALVTISVILAGCFDITEEIFLEKNGSGKYVSVIDMRQMKDMMAMLKTMAPDSLKGKDDGGMGDMKGLDSLENMWKGLEGIRGITDVRREKKEEWVFQISFKFANMAALNEAMTKRKSSDSGQVQTAGNFYTFKPGVFANNDTSMAGMNELFKGNKMGGADPNSDSLQMAMTMMKSMMGDMKYTCIYHLPGKVTSYSNKKAKLSEDGKTLTLALDLMDESDSAKTIVNEIKYK